MLRQIELHGVLADKFGKSFTLDVATPREACEALSYQIQGFKKFMMTAHQSGLFFAVFNDDSNIGEHELDMQTGASVIRIVPQIVGAGGNTMGWLQVVAGAALIGLSFVPGMQAFAPALMGAGVGMLVGGAASLLMPVPKLDTQDPDGNKPSYAFGSAVTTVAQGNPVPVLFGRRYVGGFVISAMMVSEDT